MKLLIDTGIDKRTVVSGITEFFNPEEVIGKQVSIIVNLAPRKIRGIESQGMVQMAEDATEQLTFIMPDKSVKSGSEIR